MEDDSNPIAYINLAPTERNSSDNFMMTPYSLSWNENFYVQRTHTNLFMYTVCVMLLMRIKLTVDSTPVEIVVCVLYA